MPQRGACAKLPVSLCLTCSSLAFQKAEALARTLATVKEAGITVVSLPMVNLWTQVNEQVKRGMNPICSHTPAQLPSQRAARRRTGRALQSIASSWVCTCTCTGMFEAAAADLLWHTCERDAAGNGPRSSVVHHPTALAVQCSCMSHLLCAGARSPWPPHPSMAGHHPPA